MATTSETTTVKVADGASLDVLHWFRQNHVNIENQLGSKVKSMTLTFDAATGYALTYTKVDAPTTEA